jgi:hypothetical protein
MPFYVNPTSKTPLPQKQHYANVCAFCDNYAVSLFLSSIVRILYIGIHT